MLSLNNFLKWATEQNIARSRLLHDKGLPVQWQTDRIHRLSLPAAGATNDPVRIKNMISGITMPLPASFLDSVADHSTLYISLDYDQTSAVVVDSKGYSRFNLVALFPDMMATSAPGPSPTSAPSPASIPGTPASAATTVATPRVARARAWRPSASPQCPPQVCHPLRRPSCLRRPRTRARSPRPALRRYGCTAADRRPMPRFDAPEVHSQSGCLNKALQCFLGWGRFGGETGSECHHLALHLDMSRHTPVSAQARLRE